jgi:hypothetical protein
MPATRGKKIAAGEGEEEEISSSQFRQRATSTIPEAPDPEHGTLKHRARGVTRITPGEGPKRGRLLAWEAD